MGTHEGTDGMDVVHTRESEEESVVVASGQDSLLDGEQDKNMMDAATKVDQLAIEEMQLDLDMEDEQYKLWLGGRLQTRVDSWRTLGFGTLVENGVVPDWIDGPPTERMDATRRERY